MTSTTVTSSDVRQTPAFTVPSTQNTAPVLDYRCLYTHDLRRKQKRWQDGLLRYHTFNKRIMVYDVSRNYIGDMHWREDEILQDGDDFELDRGVLIQVGEATGRTEQDLTGLLEKRKKATIVAVHEEISQQAVALPVASSIAVQPSQLRPKSLNALLGTPKGRIGRAALPTKSPHDLRVEHENSNLDQDRPAKCQRIESQVERRVEPKTMPPPRVSAKYRIPNQMVNEALVGAVVDKEPEERRIPASVRNSSLSQNGDAVSRPLTPSVSRKNDSRDEATKQAIRPSQKKVSSRSESSDLTAQPRKRKPNQDIQKSPIAKKIAKHSDREINTSYARTTIATKPLESPPDEHAASTVQQPQRSKLQIASRKSHKKLMYRDLLPQEMSTTSFSTSDSALNNRERSTSSRADKRKRHTITEFHEEEQKRLKARLNRQRAKEKQQEVEREAICGDPPEDLFLSQDSVESTTNRIAEESKERLSNISMTGLSHHRTEPFLSSTPHSPSQKASHQAIHRPPSRVSRTAMNLAKMDEILFRGAQTKIAKAIEDRDSLTELLPSPSIPKIPTDVISIPSSPIHRSHSSPAFQTQAHVPSPKSPPQETTSIVSKPNPNSFAAFVKAAQSKAQAAKRRTSDTLPGPHPSSTLLPPTKSDSTPSPTETHPQPAPNLRTTPNIHAIEPRSPELPAADSPPPTPTRKSDPLLRFSKTVAPKPPTAAHKPTKQPLLTKITPTTTTTTSNLPTETPEIQPSSSPPAEAPQPPKRKPDSLPAFTKVIPTKPQSRSPFKKSVSDTSAMRPPSAMLVSLGKDRETLPEDAGGGSESAGLWNKEAWDLFGCGRDGVECTYEEFKRKEGLM